MNKRRSAKREVYNLVHNIMLNRPLNHPRVVIELQVISSLCVAMGWDNMKRSIHNFLDQLDSGIVTKGLTEGTCNVGSEKL